MLYLTRDYQDKWWKKWQWKYRQKYLVLSDWAKNEIGYRNFSEVVMSHTCTMEFKSGEYEANRASGRQFSVLGNNFMQWYWGSCIILMEKNTTKTFSEQCNLNFQSIASVYFLLDWLKVNLEYQRRKKKWLMAMNTLSASFINIYSNFN